jgi:hypothetical protein
MPGPHRGARQGSCSISSDLRGLRVRGPGRPAGAKGSAAGGAGRAGRTSAARRRCTPVHNVPVGVGRAAEHGPLRGPVLQRAGVLDQIHQPTRHLHPAGTRSDLALDVAALQPELRLGNVNVSPGELCRLAVPEVWRELLDEVIVFERDQGIALQDDL